MRLRYYRLMSRSRLLVVGVVLLSSCAADCKRDRPAIPSPTSAHPGVFVEPLPNRDLPGLVLSPDRMTILDVASGMTWLANANLAGDATVRAALGVPGINPNGTMDYPTALAWVQALNAHDNGAGYLGRTDWQLPTTPAQDASCAVPAGRSGNSFGPSCTGGALGHLYTVGFGARFPAEIAPPTNHQLGPFHHVQQGLYWTAGKDPADPPTPRDSANAFTFTFTTNVRGRNTTAGNYFHVLPIVRGVIGTEAPAGAGLVPYTSGPAAGLAVYDTRTGVTWASDGALAASNTFGISGDTTVTFNVARSSTLTAPRIDGAGKMLFSTAHDWIQALNAATYAGADDWTLPAVAELQALYADLDLATASAQLLEHDPAGPFTNVQRFFYWSCQRAESDRRAPCGLEGPGTLLAEDGGEEMQWGFNFQSGFLGTAQHSKQFFVMVVHPD